MLDDDDSDDDDDDGELSIVFVVWQDLNLLRPLSSRFFNEVV